MQPVSASAPKLHLGLDFGTSGARVTAIDGARQPTWHRHGCLAHITYTTHRSMAANPQAPCALRIHRPSTNPLVHSKGLPYCHAGAGEVVLDSKRSYGPSASADWAATWEAVLYELLQALPWDVRQGVASLAIDGTSATAMLVDRSTSAVLAPARLYNEAQPAEAVAAAKVRAPAYAANQDP